MVKKINILRFIEFLQTESCPFGQDTLQSKSSHMVHFIRRYTIRAKSAYVWTMFVQLIILII